MPFIDRAIWVRDRRVGYVDEGPGSTDPNAPPLVLLHGAGFDHAELTWRLTTAAMRDHRRVIVPDLPGYGDSDALEAPCSLADMGRWAVAFLDALGLERVDLGGVSMGGGMALWVAINAPDRVRRLVPVCPYGLMPRVPYHPAAYAIFRAGGLSVAYRAAAASQRLARFGLAMSYGDPGRVSAKAVAELRRTAQDQMHRRSLDSFLDAELHRASLYSDLTPELGRITAPTLLVSGSADRLVPARHVRDARQHIPAASYLALPTGHWPMRERPDLFHPVLEQFLSG